MDCFEEEKKSLLLPSRVIVPRKKEQVPDEWRLSGKGTLQHSIITHFYFSANMRSG